MFTATRSMLAALILVAGVYLVQFDMTRTAKKEIANERAMHFLASENVQIAWIELQNHVAGNSQVIRFECREAEGVCPVSSTAIWEIAKPSLVDVDSVQIGAMLSSLRDMKAQEKISESTLEGKKWRQEFGFENPSLVVRAKIQGTEAPLEIQFGTTTPVGTNHYVWSNGKPGQIFVVPSFNFRTLDRDLFHWRNKRLLPQADGPKLQSLRWEHRSLGEPIEVERTGKDWSLSGREKLRADSLVLSGLGNQVTTWTASSLVDDKLFQGAQPYAKMIARYTTSGDASKEFKLEFRLSQNNKVYVQSSERAWIAEVQKSDVDKFVRTRPELRDPHVLSRGEQADAQIIRLQFPDATEPVELVRDGPIWGVRGDVDNKKYAVNAIEHWWKALTSPNILKRVPKSHPEAMAFAKNAKYVVTLLGEKMQVMRVFRISSDFRNKAYLFDETEKEVLLLSPRFVASLPERLQEWEKASQTAAQALPLPSLANENNLQPAAKKR